MRSFDRGPYVRRPAVSEQIAPSVARGVEYRTVYESELLDVPGGMEMVHESIEAGERAHVIARLPTRMVIFDDDHAMIVLTRRPGPDSEVLLDAVLVHQSPLLEVLIELFEAYWTMSVPITPAPAPGDAGDEGLRLLSMLAAGSPDASIARHLGVSERTVQRRIARLQQQHGVQSRFQLGFQIARQRLLDDGGPPAIT